MTVIKNFVYKISCCAKDWTTETFLEETIPRIREQVGNKKVLLALSGGVDSSTLAFYSTKQLEISLHACLSTKDLCEKVNQNF